jgi:Holliday junction DNA helicase RuvA
MYQYLSGRLVEKTPSSVTLDVQGVGYHILIPLSTYSALPSAGENVKLLIHHVVREDAERLYGFFTEEERGFFRLLLSISGIGPKVANTVLSGIPLPELRRAIAEGSVRVLTGISGIGKKTAERIIVELREKIALDEKTEDSSWVRPAGVSPEAVEDAVCALVELGYRKPGARNAVQKVLKSVGGSGISVPDMIRAALKQI